MNASDSSDAAASLEVRKAVAVVENIIADRKPLEVELLTTSDQRRISIEEHQAWRHAAFPPAHQVNEIDEAMADPIVDHAPMRAPRHKANRVLGILDQLEKENSNRRFNH